MARPQKSGLDYFPHDVDALGDEKIAAIMLLHGAEGYLVYFGLLERIYRTELQELELDKRNLAVTAARLHLPIERFLAIVKDAVELRLFDPVAYGERNVLTSEGIRKRSKPVLDKRETTRKQRSGSGGSDKAPSSGSSSYPGEQVEGVCATETIHKPQPVGGSAATSNLAGKGVISPQTEVTGMLSTAQTIIMGEFVPHKQTNKPPKEKESKEESIPNGILTESEQIANFSLDHLAAAESVGEEELAEIEQIRQRVSSESRRKKNPVKKTDVELVYNAYPLPTAFPKAAPAIADAIREKGLEQLLSIVADYANRCREVNYEFIPSCYKFFKERIYNDSPSTWIRGRASTSGVSANSTAQDMYDTFLSELRK